MDLKEQVVSLELAKRLKELGVKQESLWYWSNDKLYNNYGCDCTDCGYGCTKPIKGVPTFTVAELGEILPKGVMFNITDIGCNAVYQFNLDKDAQTAEETVSLGKTEADARAKLLIHLIEEKIIKTNE